VPRYDWSTPLGRLFSGMVAAVVVVFGSHMGSKHRTMPVICNGGWHAGLSVFLQLSLAAAIIESVTWAIWFVAVRPKVQPARSNIDDPGEYVLSGGQFLGPTPSNLSLALAAVLVIVSLRVVGIPDACPMLDLPKLSLRFFLGGMLMTYGVMLGINYLWKQSADRASKPSA